MNVRTRILATAGCCILLLGLAACGSSASSSSSHASGKSSSGYSSGAYHSGSGSSSSSGSSSTPNAVAIKEIGGKYAYSPGTISVKSGTKVAWSNKSDAEHSVTFDKGGFSKDIETGKGASYTFSTPGTFAYHCKYHPYMHGVVKVSG